MLKRLITQRCGSRKSRYLILLLAAVIHSVILFGISPDRVWAYEYYDEEEEDEDEDAYANDEEDDEADADGEEDFVDDEADDVEGFVVFFDANGGDITGSVYEITVYEGEKYGELPVAKRTGFSFEGWFTKSKGGTQITEDTVCNLSDDQVVHAHWKSNGGYTITYVLDGGINNKNNPDEYLKKSAKITLKDPTKTDYTFGGWYTDKAFTKPITCIKKGSSGNLTLYAKWLDNPSFSKASTSKNKVTLTWKKCSGALKYQVFQATSANGTYKSCATTKSNSTTISNLTYGKNYYYKVLAVYEIDGTLVKTEKSAIVEVCCTKNSGKSGTNTQSASTNSSTSTQSGTANSSNSNTQSGTTTQKNNTQSSTSSSVSAKNVSDKMVFYYQYDNWDFPYEKRKVSCFCMSPAMILHAMGYDCDPNKLYKVMGGVGYNPAKIQKKYGVKITQYNLTGKTEAAKKQELYEYLKNRPQGVMIRWKKYPHTQVAYLKDGQIVVNDPALKNGEGIDISKSIIKKYMNIDYVILFD
jgi:uncharacterized repeat protein (TIGR02543 family)